MTTFRPVRAALSLMVVMVSLTTTAAAQTNDEIFPTLEWNFSTPGARANGMGRSFIGLADDATAAITNPAGLMSLTRPQIYAEYKNTRLKVERLATRNSLTTIQPTANTSIVNALSFLSVSAPINSRIAVGFSVHRFLDYHEAFGLDARPIPNEPRNQVFFPVVGQADFTATAFGGSVAIMVTNALRVGVTVAGNRLIIAEPKQSEKETERLRALVLSAPSILVVLPKWYGFVGRKREWIASADMLPKTDVVDVLQQIGVDVSNEPLAIGTITWSGALHPSCSAISNARLFEPSA